MTGTGPKVVHLTSVHSPHDTRAVWKGMPDTLGRSGNSLVLIALDLTDREKDAVRFAGFPRQTATSAHSR